MEPKLRHISAQFALSGAPLYIGRYGSGHINETYLVLDDTGREYILQKINQTVFRDVEALMGNIQRVTEHLGRRGASYRQRLTLVPPAAGGSWLQDGDGGAWRMYEFICDSVSLDRVDSPGVFRQSAEAFGRFQRLLADYPAGTLHPTIPDFHNTPVRYAQLRAAIEQDAAGRAAGVAPEIAYALETQPQAATLVDLLAAGELPLRVTHNDTKLNNVLFDRLTGEALCVIDLDTVMPGLAAYDFGDSIRFGATTAAEDERDLSLVHFSLTLYRAYTEGYLAVAGDSLTAKERQTLPWGALLMTLECGVRFLADHLNGDVYFRTARPGHNLDRARTQFQLAREMAGCWAQMERAVEG